MDIDKMTPRRPYLLRAFYEWLTDNELTPHLVVDATLPGVRVPEQFIQDGQIILNIAQRAVGNLELGNESICFNARFGGTPHSVIVPLYAVQAIYARENGAGTMFEPEDTYFDMLSKVDNVDEQDMVMESIDTETSVSRPSSKGRPNLRVVK